MRRGRKVAIRAIAVLGAIALLSGIGFNRAALLDRLFFQPKHEVIATPADRGLAFTDVWFGPDRDLHGWFVPGPADLTVLWLHGNGGNIGHRVDQLQALHAALGANFFLFDYHGYGRSAGSPSESTLYADAHAALEYVRSRPETAGTQIVYFGKSLGSAVAVQLATSEPPHRLVLQSAFTSVSDVASSYLPGLGVLLVDRFPTLHRIPAVRSPVLMIHGSRDTVVPADHASTLFAAVTAPTCLVVIADAGHDDVPSVGGSRYFAAVSEFAEGARLSRSETCRNLAVNE
jgi:fermentation-respiration switch protein FrsA (DUF1100 family)